MTDSEHAEAVKLLYQNADKDTTRLLTLAGVEAPPPPPQGLVEQVRAVASNYKGEAETLRTLLVKRAATQLRCDKVKAQYQDLLRQLQQVQEAIQQQEKTVQEALVKVRDTTTIPPLPPLEEVDSILQQLSVSLTDEQRQG